MNTSAMLLAEVLWLVCAFAALGFFISRIKSVRKDTENAIEKVNGRVNGRIDTIADSIYDLIHTLAGRIEKLEDSKICVLDTDPDDTGKTALYAITKVGYSTIIVSLTEDELAVINSFIDWACLDDDFIAEKLDKDYDGVDWRNKK